MRTKQLLLALSALTLIVGACANTTQSSPGDSSAPASAAPSAAASASAPASTAPSDTAVASASAPASSGTSAAPSTATGSTAPTSTATGPSPSAACTGEQPTATSAQWTNLQAHDNDFQFKFPANWDKLYGAFVFNTSSLVDAQTFAETGLPATSETRADLVRAPGVGLPNASVLIVPGVTSNTSTIFQRQVQRFQTIPDIKILSSALVACLGGEQAQGVSFTFNKDTTYQESWYINHAGRSYDFQWLAPKGQEATDTFKEMFRTWQWTPNLPVATPLPIPSGGVPTAVPSASGSAIASSFVLAGISTKVDTAATSANPKDFVTTVPKESTAVYSVFSLKPGLTGQVNGALKQGDKVLVTLSLQYGPKNTWGDFRINSANGIAAGNYNMLITFVPSGETINLPFTVK